MNRSITSSISDHFADLEDPRIDRNQRHRLTDIVTIAICAVICGAETWVDIADFGRIKEPWFRTFLALPHGIPSHDTFGRVFARLNPVQLQTGFLSWVKATFARIDPPVVAIDGKALRGSQEKVHGIAPLAMVSAWATEHRLVLGQLQVDEKSNEITAIPALLDLLDITGCTITIDAMGCQRKIAEQIITQGGEYVLVLKGNHSHLYQDVMAVFAQRRTDGRPEVASLETRGTGHGRDEIRSYEIIAVGDEIRQRDAWRGLRSIGKVEATRYLDGKYTTHTRYFRCSIPADVHRFANAVRAHWQIENAVHWVLDVAFHEDASRIRIENGPQNMAVLRHMALNLLRTEASRGSIKTKRLRAGWDQAYFLQVLAAGAGSPNEA
jgi:predicted transposase YbfD/YdcC